MIERKIAGGAYNHHGYGAYIFCFVHLADGRLNVVEVDDCGPPDPVAAGESIADLVAMLDESADADQQDEKETTRV